MRKCGWLLVSASLLGLTGCYSGEHVELQSVAQGDRPAIARGRGIAVAGYTDARGGYHTLDNSAGAFARLVDRDSVEFTVMSVPDHGLQEGEPGQRFAVPRDSVRTLYILRFESVKSVVAVIGVTVLAIGVAAAVIAATKQSCPFIYSYDGRQYVLDGDPYGGATMKSLERTDWSELHHLVAVGGAYRLKLTNEVDETQHTNRLDLLVVDHAPGTLAVMDRLGRPHAFRRTAPLAAAFDETGADLLPWLRLTDRSAWTPSLDDWSSRDSVADTRNHITLVFPRPRDRGPVWLVSHVSTGEWGSFSIRTMLGFRGDRVEDFYAAINGSETYRQQLIAWNQREELYELFPEVRCGDRWVRQDFIPGAGPVESESRAIPLDLGGVIGDSVVIRLNPPIGYWSLNSFQLAWQDDAPRVTRLSPRAATSAAGANVLASLKADDDQYLDFPTRQDAADLEYAAPPPRPGTARTVFAETRGWYQLHMHRDGPPDLDAVTRLSNEPGYMVRHALRDYAEYMRTGVLAGTMADTAGVWTR